MDFIAENWEAIQTIFAILGGMFVAKHKGKQK